MGDWERRVFRCDCDGEHYLEVWHYPDDGAGALYGIIIAEWPSTFWRRLRSLFLGGRGVVHEILLNDERAHEVCEALHVTEPTPVALCDENSHKARPGQEEAR